jgi:putative membrane protein
MNEILSMLYLWLKSAHLIFVIFYHQECAVGSDEDRKWIEREGKLRKIILNPSLIIVWIVGLALAYNIGAFSQGWFHAKLLVVLLLTGYHGWMIGYVKKLARGERTMTDKALRLVNEVPGITAAIIVILVIIKPF